MKIFKIAYEGDNLTHSLITLVLPKKDTNVLNKVKKPFFFNFHITTISAKLDKKFRVLTKRSIRYKAPFKITYNKTSFIDGYSFYIDPVTKLKGFLKASDIAKDAGICIWGNTEIKKLTVKV